MTLLILILLIIGMVIGYRRGIILQLLHLIGTISAIIISALNYERLASRFDMIMPYPSTAQTVSNPLLPEIDNAELGFYKMVAFFMIFVVAKIVIQLIVSAFDYLQQVDAFGRTGDILGTALGLIEMIYILVVILFMATVLPLENVQTTLENSGLARFLMDNTFIISDKFIEWLKTGS
ncbi:CvpA family protein [Salinicoccus sp. ID82-1]|uniref:CvpA family protein n=1 Tax=Salinicoccus cyprini TaxID=2493691 RepID=A0A558AZF4_9STAP|nr:MULTISPECIES: CvpA family protein [Salinicoccus]MCG1009282.1 CvpA family protein [Salinicoccus sp. ID82-1]TVT29659.1 CvpA family protein [Salinicoccus cyprini]